MPINIGSTQVGKVYLGSIAARKVYLGTTQVWANGVAVSDDFNRANGPIGGEWTLRYGTAPTIASSQLRGSASGPGYVTHNSPLVTTEQRAKISIPSYAVPASGAVNAVLKMGLRGDGSGRAVVAEVRINTGTGGSSTADSGAQIRTVSSYTEAATLGSGTNRAFMWDGQAQLVGQDYEFIASGPTYTIYRAGVPLLSWTDTGDAYAVDSSCTEIGLGTHMTSSAYITGDNYEANDLGI